MKETIIKTGKQLTESEIDRIKDKEIIDLLKKYKAYFFDYLARIEDLEKENTVNSLHRAKHDKAFFNKANLNFIEDLLKRV